MSPFATYHTTLTALALGGLLLVVQLVIADLTAIRNKHKAGYPIPADSNSYLFRAARAHINTNESIAAFALFGVAGVLLGASPGWLNGLSVLWLAGFTARSHGVLLCEPQADAITVLRGEPRVAARDGRDRPDGCLT
jgi:uncharacterized MAPEG superfamily protein